VHEAADADRALKEIRMNRTLKAVVFGVLLGMVPGVANAQLWANQAPPAMRAEPQPPAPGPGFTWVAGFWNWSGNQYVWTPGRWERPPAPAQAWQAPAWEREGNRFRFRPGRWGQGGGGGGGGMAQPAMPVAQPAFPTAQPAMPVGVPPAFNAGQGSQGWQPWQGPPQGQTWQSQRPPPRPRAERRPPPPQRNMTWVPGFWSWNNNQHDWTPGRWEAPPRPRARWQSPQWVRRGRQFVFQPGRWR